MHPESETRKLIKNEEIKKLREFMMKTLDSTDDKGQPDLEKIIYNATYNMGEGAIEIAGLAFQEQLKLEMLEDTYRKKRAETYRATMTDRIGWNPTAEGVRTMVDGDIEMSELKLKMEKQRQYVEFLRECQETIRKYPMNAASLVKVATFGKEIGKII